MGVYIKRMEMPANCESCQFRRCVSDLIMFGWVGCQLDVGMAKKESFKGRHPDCPLVEVKAPHGDLIDRDKVIEEMCVKYTKAERQKKLMYASVEVKQGFCDLLTDAPTVIEAEGNDED